MTSIFKSSSSGVTFSVKVVPRASQNRIVGVEGDAIKIRLTAPPIEGKANDALVRYLADLLGVQRGQVEIVAGHASRRKICRVRGIAAEKIEELVKKPGS